MHFTRCGVTLFPINYTIKKREMCSLHCFRAYNCIFPVYIYRHYGTLNLTKYPSWILEISLYSKQTCFLCLVLFVIIIPLIHGAAIILNRKRKGTIKEVRRTTQRSYRSLSLRRSIPFPQDFNLRSHSKDTFPHQVHLFIFL